MDASALGFHPDIKQLLTNFLSFVCTNAFRYGRKDKRPLDPPPVVQVKFFQLVRQGSMDQVEEEFDTYE